MEPVQKADFDPWRVIISELFKFESDEIVNIIDTTGLQVDWQLTPTQGFSHKTRKREYRPRIQAIYDELSDEDKMRVSWIVASEIIRQNPESELRSKLRDVGWKLEGNRLTTERSDVREMFFPKGAEYDAYKEIKNILQYTNNSIIIVDPYIDGSILTMMTVLSSKQVQIKILTSQLPSDFNLEAKKFLKQFSQFSLEVKKTKEFHDRFVIIDDSKCYHLGASIKDAGNKAFMISQIEDSSNIKALIEQQKRSWSLADEIKIG